ncbi:hypothetical protein DUI87_10455 [Hirundo rustica rustica]|uniref:Glucagon / GIP / secretin / VIP family domain-containing protein n=1 Tax=Hirundo rustica rustica TaxID=333673 RepID=A0A3M0KI50_HIRRU|nr:hypothetical protein DUI87_10455 [Hirundo rustica rustica]
MQQGQVIHLDQRGIPDHSTPYSECIKWGKEGGKEDVWSDGDIEEYEYLWESGIQQCNTMLKADTGEHANHAIIGLEKGRLGNRVPFAGASEPDQARGSLKSESDILQNTLPENEKFYFDLSRIIDSSQDSPVKRHSDAVFTDNYSRFRKQMAVKKYLNSVLTGKRSQEELNPAKLRDEAELLEPSFSENYDSVDELLSHLPLLTNKASDGRTFIHV